MGRVPGHHREHPDQPAQRLAAGGRDGGRRPPAAGGVRLRPAPSPRAGSSRSRSRSCRRALRRRVARRVRMPPPTRARRDGGLEAYLGAAVLVALALVALGGRVAATGALRAGGSDPARPGGACCCPRARAARGADPPRRRLAAVGVVVGLAALVALPGTSGRGSFGGAVPSGHERVRTDDRSGPTICPRCCSGCGCFPRRGRGSALPVGRLGRRRRGLPATSAWAVAVLVFVAAGCAHVVALEAIRWQVPAGTTVYRRVSAAALGLAVAAVGGPVLPG